MYDFEWIRLLRIDLLFAILVGLPMRRYQSQLVNTPIDSSSDHDQSQQRGKRIYWENLAFHASDFNQKAKKLWNIMYWLNLFDVVEYNLKEIKEKKILIIISRWRKNDKLVSYLWNHNALVIWNANKNQGEIRSMF